MPESAGSSSNGAAVTVSKKPPSTIEAIKKIAEIAQEGMRDSPPTHRAIIAMSVIGAIIAIVASMALIQMDYPIIAMVMIGMSTILLLIGMVLITLVHLKRKAKREARWLRFVPDILAVLERGDQYRTRLEQIRDRAASLLTERAGFDDITDDSVRANIFLADYEKVEGGVACELFMPEGLRLRMHDPDEWGLRFKPGEGVTGRTFLGQQARIEASDYNLNPLLLKLVTIDLSMILSIPLNHPRHGYTMAVLNVDVLDPDRSHDDLREALANVSEDKELRRLVSQLASEFASLARVEISIYVVHVDADIDQVT